MDTTVKITGECHVNYFVCHAYWRHWNFYLLVGCWVDSTDKVIVISEEFSFESVVKGKSDPFLSVKSAEVYKFWAGKDFDSEISIWGDEDDEILVFCGDIEDIHILFGEVFDIEFDIEMESFGERPFHISIHHFESSFFTISNEIIIRLSL